MAEKKRGRGRPLNYRQQKAVIEHIQTTQIVKRLQDHVLGLKNQGKEVLLTSTQVRAAEILLAKRLPNLAAIEHMGDAGSPISFVIRNG